MSEAHDKRPGISNTQQKALRHTFGHLNGPKHITEGLEITNMRRSTTRDTLKSSFG